ncbi:hypothetical protein ACFFTM_02855 [Pseudoduganella plicata]|uniref:Sn-glycerol-3-phosphate transporter n=1 Tax=Pseudoduganella plicata TaxID=321984 RepID=A0A4P7B9K7_9BURK|nr:hypothetical protein [Pseudoduganella plicata]QBQ35216.1 hypothetical protein E1742_02805 [Pseudoduganella plicata]GGZ04994.1 hypothetical protein GCM10007388_43210 [Pseudoduganella plicata]
MNRIALLGAAMATLSMGAQANPFELIDSQPRSELWVNPGFYSYHVQSDKDLDNTNPGIGAEYRFSTVASATVGRFHNSDRAISNYIGVYYQPVAIGPVRIGAVVGAFDGYPKMRDGGWFPAVIPIVSVEYNRFGVNFAIVPTYKDRLHGALAVQLKFKLF